MCKLVYVRSGGGFSLLIYTVIARHAALNYSVDIELPGLASLEIVCHGLMKTGIGYCSPMKPGYLCMVKTDVGECYVDEENALQRHVLKKSHLMEGALLCFGQE
ncbi:unnamed protein product [Euphydryas editha]|uniref:Uncharacterized protein n=1 Tax=Euphydryas editha TaxID=104508 RepID=A0AAU9TEA0_EUPED|nr:unnamed protein product [Euphydryas editha]